MSPTMVRYWSRRSGSSMSKPKMAPNVYRFDIRKKQYALISMCTSMAATSRVKTPLARPRSRIRASTSRNPSGRTPPRRTRPVSWSASTTPSRPGARSARPRLPGARHGVLHVVYADHAIIDSDLSGFGHAEMEAARDADAAAVAAAAGEIATAAGLPYTFERRQEAPADAIISAARARAAELGDTPVIVVGRAGHAAHQILGSVPTRLLHHSPYPVLTIP